MPSARALKGCGSIMSPNGEELSNDWWISRLDLSRATRKVEWSNLRRLKPVARKTVQAYLNIQVSVDGVEVHSVSHHLKIPFVDPDPHWEQASTQPQVLERIRSVVYRVATQYLRSCPATQVPKVMLTARLELAEKPFSTVLTGRTAAGRTMRKIEKWCGSVDPDARAETERIIIPSASSLEWVCWGVSESLTRGFYITLQENLERILLPRESRLEPHIHLAQSVMLRRANLVISKRRIAGRRLSRYHRYHTVRKGPRISGLRRRVSREKASWDMRKQEKEPQPEKRLVRWSPMNVASTILMTTDSGTMMGMPNERLYGSPRSGPGIPYSRTVALSIVPSTRSDIPSLVASSNVWDPPWLLGTIWCDMHSSMKHGINVLIGRIHSRGGSCTSSLIERYVPKGTISSVVSSQGLKRTDLKEHRRRYSRVLFYEDVEGLAQWIHSIPVPEPARLLYTLCNVVCSHPVLVTPSVAAHLLAVNLSGDRESSVLAGDLVLSIWLLSLYKGEVPDPDMHLISPLDEVLQHILLLYGLMAYTYVFGEDALIEHFLPRDIAVHLEPVSSRLRRETMALLSEEANRHGVSIRYPSVHPQRLIDMLCITCGTAGQRDTMEV